MKRDFDGTEIKIKAMELTRKRKYIFALLDKEGEIVFIGRSSNPHQMAASYKEEKDFDSYKFFECDAAEADGIAITLQAKYRPKLNGSYKYLRRT